MKILFIADREARKLPWFQNFESSGMEIDIAESVFEANDLFLTGLALGNTFSLVVLHHTQFSSDAKKLMVYWRVQDPSLAVLFISARDLPKSEDLDDIGIIEIIREDEQPSVVQNHFRFLLQRTRDQHILGLKIQILEEFGRHSDAALAISNILAMIVGETDIHSASFIRFSDKPDEPILQITEGLDIRDQIWIDEICEDPDDSLVTIMQDGHMVRDGQRTLFPVTSSRGWEGLLIFILEDDAPITSTHLESLSKTIHQLLERVRVNAELKAKTTEKATYLSLLNDTMKNSIKESVQKMDLLKMIVKEERATTMLERAENQIERTLFLLNDIIELARIDDGLMVLMAEPVDLVSAIRKGIESVQSMAIERGISLKFAPPETPPTIDADAKKIQQVIYNLLLFLLEHCESDDTLEVSIIQGTKGYIYLRMYALTAPVDQAFLDKLFERPEPSFLLGENNVSLYICKKFIQAHEGRIRAELDPKKGFSFIVQLRAHL